MEATITKQVQLDNPLFYNNRELSWLAFNERVLEEAMNPENPLLERLKFLAIFGSNLDEFFMVRVAGLKDQVKAGFNKPENKAGLTPKFQLNAISLNSHRLIEWQYETFSETFLELMNEKIEFVHVIDSLSEKHKTYLEEYFDIHIFPVLTPMAVDAYRPFPILLNKSINLAVLIEDREEFSDNHEKLAIVQVPSCVGSIFAHIGSQKSMIIMLEDIISWQIGKLFKGFNVKTITQFRITRNADMKIHEEGARDLLKEIEEELKKRKWGAAVRLEVKSSTCNDFILHYLQEELEIHYKDMYVIEGAVDLTFFSDFILLSQKKKNI